MIRKVENIEGKGERKQAISPPHPQTKKKVWEKSPVTYPINKQICFNLLTLYQQQILEHHYESYSEVADNKIYMALMIEFSSARGETIMWKEQNFFPTFVKAFLI